METDNPNTPAPKPAENRENPLFGRKVFFVNPHLIIENLIVTELRNNEYEVYVIDDYKEAKPILKSVDNALVFIYIDSAMSHEEWYNYIKSFQLDEKLKSVFVGVISIKATTAEQQKFLMDLNLAGGFIHVSRALIDVNIEQIKEILDLNGAKGCRKYIRLDSKKLDIVNGYFVYKDKLYTFIVDNISSVGFACYYSPEIAAIFKKGTVQPFVSLTLGKRTIIASSLVFDTRIVNGKGFSVLLFTKEVDRDTRNQIRTFIFDVLDERLRDSIQMMIPDVNDYKEEVKLPDEANVPKISEIDGSFENELPEINETSANT